MRKYIKSSNSFESYLDESSKREYVEDLAYYHPGKYDQEGIGWLAKRYGLSLIEMLDVLEYAAELDYAECIKFGVQYNIFAFEG